MVDYLASRQDKDPTVAPHSCPDALSLPRSVLPVGGRLKHFAPEWREITSDPWVIEVISQGLSLTFKGSLPPLSVDPKPIKLPMDPQKRKALLDAVKEMLSKRAVARCQTVEPAFFAHLFVVPKKNGGWRPCIDLSLLNKFLAVPHFKMETVQSIRAQLQQGEYVIVLDLQDAYFHIPIKQSFQKFLKFCIMGVVYKFLTLCFGLASAPRVFTMVMRSIVKFVRNLGMKLHAYLDDWLRTKSLSGHSFGPTEEVARSSSEIRNSSQLSQVEFDSETDLRLSRGKIQSCKGTSLPNSGVSVKTQSLDRVLPDSASSSSKSIIVFSGSAQSSRRFDSTGKVTYQTYPMVSQMLLQTSCGSSLQEDSPETSIFSVPSVLEKSGFFTSRQPSASASGAGIGLHRCQSVRLGCSAEQSDSSRSMESARFRTPFQHSGNDGHDKRASEFSGTCKSEGRHVCFRQSHCSVSCTETGRDSFLDSVFQDSPVVSVGGTVGSNSQSSMDARKGSHRSGLFEPITSSYGGGMVFTRCSIPQTADSFSGDEDRSLCNFIQSETASFCKSQSGSRSTGSGCVFYLLGRLDSLCLSSNKVVTSSSSQNRAGSSLHPSDSASLARPSVVSNYPQSVDRLSEETSVPQETSVTEEWENVSFQPSETASSRLAIIKRSLQEKGFSEEVSERASLANRESTRSIYDSRFSKFSEWCKSRQRPLAEVTIQEIADFLLELFEKGLLVNTIKGYRSAISSAMGLFEGVTVGSHPVISKLINGFEVQRPVCRSYFPCWDLNVVLRVLMKSPFEPPSFNTVQDRKYTTWKTVFLIALASAKRASEIHAISRSKRDLIFLKDGVQLRAIPGFLGKTQSASCDAKPYTIADHQQFVGRDTVDRLLCPKRMLKYYLNFTESFKSQSRLSLNA